MDRDGGPWAGRVGEDEQANEPEQEPLPVPGPEPGRAEGIDVHRLQEPRRRDARGPEVPALGLAAGEGGSHHLGQSQDLRRCQSRGRDRRVSEASMGSRPLEIDERQDRGQELHSVLDDVRRRRIGAVGQRTWVSANRLLGDRGTGSHGRSSLEVTTSERCKGGASAVPRGRGLREGPMRRSLRCARREALGSGLGQGSTVFGRRACALRCTAGVSFGARLDLHANRRSRPRPFDYVMRAGAGCSAGPAREEGQL